MRRKSWFVSGISVLLMGFAIASPCLAQNKKARGWGGYRQYDIEITFYSQGTDNPITAVTIQQGGSITVDYDFVNYSAYTFGPMWAQTVYTWADGTKYQPYVYTFPAPVLWTAPQEKSTRYSMTFSVPSDAPPGAGSLTFTLYGTSWEFVHQKQASMMSRPGGLTVTVQ